MLGGVTYPEMKQMRCVPWIPFLGTAESYDFADPTEEHPEMKKNCFFVVVFFPPNAGFVTFLAGCYTNPYLGLVCL